MLGWNRTELPIPKPYNPCIFKDAVSILSVHFQNTILNEHSSAAIGASFINLLITVLVVLSMPFRVATLVWEKIYNKYVL